MTSDTTLSRRPLDASGTPLLNSERAGESWLRRLRVIALVLPPAFLLVALAFRSAFVRTVAPAHGHLLLDGVLVLGTLVFSVVMFSLIDRSYRTVLQENRDLAAVDAVVVAARQAYSVDAVAEAAMVAIVEVTGASAVHIAASHPADPSRRPDTWEYTPGHRWREDRAQQETVPLLSGPEAVGSLTVTGIDTVDGPLTHAAYAGIGCAVGSALQRARYLSHLQQEAHDATVAERDRIAREMHDSLAQALGAAHLRLVAMGYHPDVEASPEVQRELDDLARTCHEAYADVREAILGLRESGRRDRSLLEILERYVATFARQSGIVTTLSTDLSDLAMPPLHEIQVIRVVQEALTNVRKHAGATHAFVRIGAEPGSVIFVVEDDGRGFDVGSIGRGEDHYGLATMTERTQLLDGWLTIDSNPGHGTRIVLGVPAGHGVRTEVSGVMA